MVNTNIKIIFGGGGLGHPEGGWSTKENIEELLKVLEEEGIKVIDTAQAYGASETFLGESNAASRFVIDTKYPGGLIPREATKETIITSGEDSLKKLKTDCVDIYYIHAPDHQNPLEELLAGINTLHQSGKFKRFGLSNFTAEEVEDVIRIAKKNNWVVPSVYQGNYSAVARRTETEIIPTLRKHNIAFYAYSPIAGGFLTKTPEELLAGGKGRWNPGHFLGKLSNALYNKPGMLKGLEMWGEIAKDMGVTKAELAYRWIAYNSILRGELGDGIIIGAKNMEQLKETLAGLKNGPLSEEVAGKIDEMWKLVEEESPLDNYNDFIALQQKGLDGK